MGVWTSRVTPSRYYVISSRKQSEKRRSQENLATVCTEQTEVREFLFEQILVLTFSFGNISFLNMKTKHHNSEVRFRNTKQHNVVHSQQHER